MSEDGPSMADVNLALWRQVSKTNPQFTKKAEVSGQNITAINAIYTVMMATEAWGPIGVNWGYNIIEDRLDTGGTHFDEDKNIIGNTITHTIKLELWVRKQTLDPSRNMIKHKSEDPLARVVHFGHTPYIYWSRSYKYWITDQEAPKKSLTDALKKCLSLFGFSADIYMGLYDDFAYVELLKNTQAIEESDDKLVEHIRQKQEYEDWLLKTYKLIETAVSKHELEVVFKSAYRKIQRQEDRENLKKFTRAKDKRIKQLEEKADGKTTVRNDNGDQGAESAGGHRSGNGGSGSGHAGSDSDGLQRQGAGGSPDLFEPGAGRGSDRQRDKAPASKKKAVRKPSGKAD